MTKLTNTISILSRAGHAAKLIAIDAEAKTCMINNGEDNIIKWSSASSYKLDSDNPRVLTPAVLKALAEAEIELQKKNAAAPKKGKINDNEKLFLAAIPQLPDYKGVDSEMSAFALVKKVEEAHSLPIAKVRSIFASLRDKGYYIAKGKREGQTRTTFTLSELGIQYLTDNNLLAVA